ncbi:MAG: short-chain dehydrogenase [Caulobacter sp.]|nr:short-chain dehydrogenase [Caulobacter sp.]
MTAMSTAQKDAARRALTGLDGKVALITGGGAGIGRGVAEAFALLGASVVVAEIDAGHAAAVRAALADLGGDHLVIEADVTEKADVERVVEGARARFGRLDVLVNNVGHFLAPKTDFADTDEASWDALYRINLHHVFLVTRAAIPLMTASGQGGSIINISTIEALRGIPGMTAYSTFKAALGGFTRSLALELGPKGIRVNAVAPETTESEQVRALAAVPPEHHDQIPLWFPIGRFGQPSDTAGCAVFLATELSAWVTGTTISVDGGALAAGGYYRMAAGNWTHTPVITHPGSMGQKPKG